MKIVTWNVNGLRACAQKGFIEFLEQEEADIVCLQETKAHPDQIEIELHAPMSYQSYWSTARRKGYSGTVTYTTQKPRHVSRGIGIREFDWEGRFVVTEFEEFKLYNVYFPNGTSREERHLFKQEFLRRFLVHLKNDIKAGKQVILVGDYNVAYLDIDVYDSELLSSESGFLPEEREWFQNFLNSGFVDTFRKFHPDASEQYSWWTYKENARRKNKGWRIDHICVSEGLVDKVTDCRILQGQLGSDHCPVIMEMNL